MFRTLGISGGDIIGFLFVALLAFIILREFVCWYWKINKMATLLEKIEKNTRNLKTESVREKVDLTESVDDIREAIKDGTIS